MIRTLLVLLVAAALAAAWGVPRAGRYLVVDTLPERADVIVVLAGPRVERWLEGVELYRDKIAPKIVLSSGRIEPAEDALRARGIRFPREADLMKDAMIQLGVAPADVEIFAQSVDNTAAEASATRALAATRGWRRILVVTSKYHTRRSLYAFAREFSGTGVHVQLRASRFDGARPHEWWKHRPDQRFVISELQKLLAYRLGLGE